MAILAVSATPVLLAQEDGATPGFRDGPPTCVGTDAGLGRPVVGHLLLATSRAAVAEGAHAGCYRNRAELGQAA